MIKRLYNEYKPFFKGVFSAIGIIVIFDWVIAPGLTVANTFINILSLLLGSFLILIFGLEVWVNIFKKDKKEEKEVWQNHSETTGPIMNENNENEKNKDNENLSNLN